jgi:hypothetical protein
VGVVNTARGANALYSNTTGSSNSVAGANSLYFNTSGSNNTAFGYEALYNLDGTGNNNTAVGSLAGHALNGGAFTNATALGSGANLTASNSVTLGSTLITAIYAQVTTITGISDWRRKKDIWPLGADLGLDFIEKLQPVYYRFNNGDDTERYGFIAQDLEQALPVSLHDTIERSEPGHAGADRTAK